MDYHLGYSARGRQSGLTLGTQQRFFHGALKRDITQVTGDNGETDQGQDAKKVAIGTERPKDTETQDPPRTEETGEDGNGPGAGSEAPATHTESTDPGSENTEKTASDPPIEEQSGTKQEDQPGSETGTTGEQDGTEGTTSGLRGTDRESSAEGGDGLSPADREHQE